MFQIYDCSKFTIVPNLRFPIQSSLSLFSHLSLHSYPSRYGPPSISGSLALYCRLHFFLAPPLMHSLATHSQHFIESALLQCKSFLRSDDEIGLSKLRMFKKGVSFETAAGLSPIQCLDVYIFSYSDLALNGWQTSCCFKWHSLFKHA